MMFYQVSKRKIFLMSLEKEDCEVEYLKSLLGMLLAAIAIKYSKISLDHILLIKFCLKNLILKFQFVKKTTLRL